MAERVAELGGRFDISSGVLGTVVRAALPCTTFTTADRPAL